MGVHAHTNLTRSLFTDPDLEFLSGDEEEAKEEEQVSGKSGGAFFMHSTSESSRVPKDGTNASGDITRENVRDFLGGGNAHDNKDGLNLSTSSDNPEMNEVEVRGGDNAERVTCVLCAYETELSVQTHHPCPTRLNNNISGDVVSEGASELCPAHRDYYTQTHMYTRAYLNAQCVTNGQNDYVDEKCHCSEEGATTIFDAKNGTNGNTFLPTHSVLALLESWLLVWEIISTHTQVKSSGDLESLGTEYTKMKAFAHSCARTKKNKNGKRRWEEKMEKQNE